MPTLKLMRVAARRCRTVPRRYPRLVQMKNLTMKTSTHFNFTQQGIAALPAPIAGTRATYYDSKTPGLQLRITPNSVKTFGVHRWTKGNLRRAPCLGGRRQTGVGRRAQSCFLQMRTEASIQHEYLPARPTHTHCFVYEACWDSSCTQLFQRGVCARKE